jgi:universal stress protein E
MSFKKILLIIHGDGLEQPGVKRLLEIAGEDVEVEVFEPVYNTHLEAYPLNDNEAYERLRDRLVKEKLDRVGQLAEQLTNRGLKSTGMAAWDYPMSDAIVRRALAIDADLVITEPLEGRAGALSQGDWRLISRCPVPLLLLRSEETADYSNIVAAVDPFHTHGKPAELDETIVRTAKQLQSVTHASLQVLHCFVPLTYMAPGVDAVRLPLDDAEQALEAYRRDALEELATSSGLERSSAKLIKGKPHEVLQSMTEHGEADLLVMGGLSRGRIRDFVLGNTAEKLVHDSRADLLILKPIGFKTTVVDHMPEPPLVGPLYYPF